MKNANQTPFWNKRFKEFDVNIEAEDIINEIKKLPILTKNEVKDNYTNIYNPKGKGKIYFEKTSGSNGASLVVPKTSQSIKMQWMIWWRYRYNLGINLNTWMAWLGSEPNLVSLKVNQPPYWRINKFGKQLMLSTYHLNINTVEYFYNELINREISWLHGYANSVYFFASLIEEKKLPYLPMKFVTTGGENLMDFQINLIKKIFGVKPFDHYGQVEGVANFSMLPNRKYKIDYDLAYTEFIKINDLDDLHMVVGTNYTNFVFPLIRYNINDFVDLEFLDNQIFINNIEGRNEDFIVLPNGTKLGRLSGLLEDIENILDCQIYQPNQFLLIFKIVKTINYNPEESEKRIIEKCFNRIPPEVKIQFEYVQSIEKTKRGKLKFVVSDVKQQLI